MRYTHVLDTEWLQLSHSPLGRRHLRQWARSYPALEGHVDLQALLDARMAGEAAAQPILLALARLAPTDGIAARTLLQALLPAIVHLASRKCADDPSAAEDLVALAWERIRTYPRTRLGSVAANISRDVYKRYRADYRLGGSSSATFVGLACDPRAHPSAEDEAMSKILIDELVAAGRRGVVPGVGVGLILRTRVAGTPIRTIATEEGVHWHTMVTRRRYAEQRLRQLRLAG